MKRKIRFIIIIMLSFFLVACSNNKDLKDVVNEVASYRNVERMTSSKTMLNILKVLLTSLTIVIFKRLKNKILII